MLAILTSISLILTTILITTIIIYYKWSFQYWRKRKIPSAEASMPFGSMKNPIFEIEHIGQLYERMYREAKAKGHKHLGFFVLAKPIFMPIDLELIKCILSKDFNNFINRGFYFNEKDDPLSVHLFSMEGEKWKNLRAKITPSLSPGKLKILLPLMVQHAMQLNEAIEKVHLSGERVDVKEIMGNYTMDVIGSTAFGLDCNSFKNPNSEYRRKTKRFFSYTKLEAAKIMIFMNNHNLGRFLNYCITPQEVTDFFMKTIKETVSYRETNNFKRNDFMQTLIELKNDPDPSMQLSLKELAAESFVFFAAASETTSAVLCFSMYELASHEAIQERVREEVKKVLRNYGNEITYEALSEMKYMQQVMDETLRKYPVAPMLNRRCLEDYRIPGTDVILEKGTDVIVPLVAILHDEEYYPNSQKFDPERFNEVNKTQLPPYSFIPFGEGPRICIGSRFSTMQVKVLITMLLNNFRFSLNEGTPKTLTVNPYSIVLTTSDNILLNVERVA